MLDELREFALRIAPELGEREFYVADMRAAGLPTTGGSGFAVDYLPTNALNIPDWRGPGAVLALDVGGTRQGAKRGRAEACLKAIAVHEVAHLVPQPTPATLKVIESKPATAPGEINKAMRVEMATPADLAPRALKVHDVYFIRRCVHLWARALAAGHTVFGGDVLGYEWLSKLEAYASPLLGDAINMMDAPFSEIDRLPIPEHTRELHEGDVERYHLRFPSEEADAN